MLAEHERGLAEQERAVAIQERSLAEDRLREETLAREAIQEQLDQLRAELTRLRGA